MTVYEGVQVTAQRTGEELVSDAAAELDLGRRTLVVRGGTVHREPLTDEPCKVNASGRGLSLAVRYRGSGPLAFAVVAAAETPRFRKARRFRDVEVALQRSGEVLISGADAQVDLERRRIDLVPGRVERRPAGREVYLVRNVEQGLNLSATCDTATSELHFVLG